MDPIPGSFYFKGVILVRAPQPMSARFAPKREEKPQPLRPPIAPLPHPKPLAPPRLRLVSIA